MRTPEPEFGAPVQLRMHKWDGSPHRHTTMTYLGSDEHGRWLGHRRPSSDPAKGVSLIPYHECFLAHFNTAPSLNSIYTDITTAPEFGWEGTDWVATAADMDLDIVLRNTGKSWIDDEDEFAEHTAHYGYPPDVVATTRATADAVLAAVRAGSDPFGNTWRRWVDVLVGNEIHAD